MLFQLTTPLAVKVARMSTPARKKGSDVFRTTDITVEFEGSNEALLPLFAPELLELYRPLNDGESPEQRDLAGVDTVSNRPVLRFGCLQQPLRLDLEFAGYHMILDRGLGAGKGGRPSSNVESDEVTIKRIRIWTKEGGTVKGDMHLQGLNFSAEQVGWLRDMLLGPSTLQLAASATNQDIEDEQQSLHDAGEPHGSAPSGKRPSKPSNVTKPKPKTKPPKTTSSKAGRRKPDTAAAATDAYLASQGADPVAH